LLESSLGYRERVRVESERMLEGAQKVEEKEVNTERYIYHDGIICLVMRNNIFSLM
jgi:hypothetical protein